RCALLVVWVVVTVLREVAVESVGREVQLAAQEPLEERRAGAVEHRVERLDPLQGLGLLAPEPLEVCGRAVVDLCVRDACPRREVIGRREAPALLLERRDGRAGVAHRGALLGNFARRNRSYPQAACRNPGVAPPAACRPVLSWPRCSVRAT